MSRRVQNADPRAVAGALAEAVGLDAGGDWEIVARGHSPALESVLAVGNGFLGLRGAPEEGAPAHDPGAVVNGFHETWPIVYPEDAYGLARTGQTIVPPPDGTIIRLTVDGEPLEVSGAVRALDMGRGLLTREIEHVTPPPVAAVDDPRVGKGFAEKPLVPEPAICEDASAILELSTRTSGLRLACGIEHRVTGAERLSAAAAGDEARVVFGATLAPGGSVRLGKLAAHHWGGQAP